MSEPHRTWDDATPTFLWDDVTPMEVNADEVIDFDDYAPSTPPPRKTAAEKLYLMLFCGTPARELVEDG